jgi:hypothetical protein
MTTVKPLDLILFVGDDFISKTIGDLSKGERCVPSLTQSDRLPNSNPNTPLWSHAGVVIDSTVFPHLSILKPGKLYIYESIFSGSILNFTYSEVLPVDNTRAARKGRCAGPQIRDLEAVAKGTFFTSKIGPGSTRKIWTEKECPGFRVYLASTQLNGPVPTVRLPLSNIPGNRQTSQAHHPQSL